MLHVSACLGTRVVESGAVNEDVGMDVFGVGVEIVVIRFGREEWAWDGVRKIVSSSNTVSVKAINAPKS